MPDPGHAGVREDPHGTIQGLPEPALVEILAEGEVGNVGEGLFRAERGPGEFAVKAPEISGSPAETDVDHRPDRAERAHLPQAQPQGGGPPCHSSNRLQHFSPAEGQGPGGKDRDVRTDEGKVGIVEASHPVRQAGKRGGDREDHAENPFGPVHRLSCLVDGAIAWMLRGFTLPLPPHERRRVYPKEKGRIETRTIPRRGGRKNASIGTLGRGVKARFQPQTPPRREGPVSRPAHELESRIPDSGGEDLRIIAGILKGVPAAMQRLDGWIDVVLARGFRTLHPEWEDLRQEIRIRILRNLRAGHFNGRSCLRTYVHRIARNTSIDFSRRARRLQDPGVGQAGEPRRAEDREWNAFWVAQDLLEKILRDLTEGERTLVRLIFAEQFSYQEIAGKLGIPEGTVKSRMARCRKRILQKRRELTDP